MSASEEEAFASAEEGEEKVNAASGKKKKGSDKSQPAAAKDKGGGGGGSGKQKTKQQQQRKKKSKAQAAPTETKTSSAPNAPEKRAGEGSKDVKSVTADKAEGSKAEGVASSTSGADERESKQDSTPSDSVGSADTLPPGSKSDEISKPDSSEAETADSPKDTKSEKGTENEKNISQPQGKSAGEIRLSLSSSTKSEDSGVKNPGEQAIPREVDSSADGTQAEAGGEKQSDGGQGDGWNWGWGSSLLNAATNSLETFSSQVGEGLTTIMDTVESSLGVPDPSEMARAESATEPDGESGDSNTVTAQPHEKEASEETAGKEGAEQSKAGDGDGVKDTAAEVKGKEEAAGGGGWLSGWGMSDISNMGKSLVSKSQNLMNTGFEKAETLAAGGLDILETIGKKTYTTLTEHDPGLRRAREFLHLNEEKPSLSSVLREAKEQEEERAKQEVESEEALKCNFTALFEDNQGFAHLEALEMLSNRSERKVQSLLSAMEDEMLDAIRTQLVEIKDVFQQACNTEDDKEQAEESEHDFSKLVTENLSELHLGTAPDKLNKVQEAVRQWIADFYSHEEHSEISDAKEVQQRAIQSLADVTSKALEQFHKAGELVLIQKDEEKSYTQRAQSLAKLSSVLVTEVDILASKFSQCLNKIGEEKNTTEEVNPMVTSVYLEASNAGGYIQDAFQLLLPVLQHAAIQSSLSSL